MRGSDLSGFPHGVEKGIRLHRYLDRFTDTHAALRVKRQTMSGLPRRFTGIVIDVLLDHYLALNWARHSDLSLELHAVNVHKALKQNHPILPERLKRFVHVLQKERILQNNVHLASIEATLERLSRRSSRFAPLALSAEQLEPIFAGLTDTFQGFYPELHHAALNYLGTYPVLAESRL